MTIKKYILIADDVVNNLTSDLEDVPLSASQGKVLKGMIDGGITPKTHASTHAAGGTDPITPASIGAEPAFSKNNAFNKNFGTASGTVCQGNDSRLSDARTPTAHNHAASDITSGTLSADRIPSLTKSKISDFPTSMTPTAHASTATTYGVSSASNYGHPKATSATPSALGTASVGTDNGLYARGDHVHRNPITISTADPSGGVNGDVWFKYEA